MEQRSYANSTLNITNGEAVSHHYSYDRQAEKEMGVYNENSSDPEDIGSGHGKATQNVKKRVSTPD